ncbi:hypothetical protein [Novosphingobium album (ex Liu et al. 2023)]|uniref:Uncharacterized protein n=1 Tax=Novosphingobium album (ex Liu et al. 2023) TaxID=3031130 RepID=A0ABT5WRF6_9SPHN|nr:hypothetical protein [Novosphingobium album (ex Liu et al. 2023)]MDE8652622.1 hypothetical protein [Novosphingobium album (ex Liu et al. 2023)]
MKRVILSAACLAGCIPVAAHAGACEDSFQKSGNAVTGLRFRAAASVADLSPDMAIRQMEGVAKARGYTVLASEPAGGSLLLEQPMSGKARAFPLEVRAVSAGGFGTVSIEAKLPAAMSSPAEAVKSELCLMLGGIKGGKEGKLAAGRAARAAPAAAAPVAISALEFSHQISKDTERNSAAIVPRYTGKQFTLSGEIDYVIRDGEYYRVAFKIPDPWNEALRLPNAAKFKTDLSCLMAPGQSVWALQQKPGRQVRLTGTFYRFDEFRHAAWFNECVPAQGR